MIIQQKENGQWHVRLSHSSYSTLCCPYKAWMYCINGWSTGIGISGQFGSAFHDAVPTLIQTGNLTDAYQYFDASFKVPQEKWTKWYSPQRGHAMLANYHAAWHEHEAIQTLVINDKPQIERKSILTLFDSPKLLLEWEVRIDRIVFYPETPEELWVLDTKTTGSSNMDSWKETTRHSGQFVGYGMDAAAFYGMTGKYKVRGTIIDAIYTKKLNPVTSDCFRFEILRNPWREKELINDVLAAAYHLIDLKTGLVVPHRQYSQCSAYGGSCPYLKICAAPYNENMAESLFVHSIRELEDEDESG